MEHGDKIPVVTELLKAEGLNGEEISSLNQLGGRIYNAELSSARIKNLQNIITPTLIAGIIYPYANEFLTAIFASAAGASYWIGRTAFTSMNIVRAAATRAARSAKSIEWLSDLLEGHLKDVTKLNIISQTPTIATIITLLSASKDAAAGLLFATSFSLSGLVNTLTTKRAAVDAHRATEIVTGLGNVLNRETVLITDNSWEKFLSNNPPIEYTDLIDFQRGLILDNVASELPNGARTDIQNFSITARSGEVTVIKGGSGKGKSQLWLGPRNITRYSGEVYVVDNGVATNTKSLPRRDISKHIRIFGQGQINPKSELVDIFNPVFKFIDDQHYAIPLEKQELWYHIRDIEDNLLSADIIKRQGGSPNYLDLSLLTEITKFREARLSWVNSLLESAGGNLNIAGMHGKRVFGQDSLSDGQRQRIVMLLAELTARYNSEVKGIILDEPLDKLDHGLNVGLQLQAIGRIKNQTNGPEIIVISHQLVGRLCEQLNASVIDLD